MADRTETIHESATVIFKLHTRKLSMSPGLASSVSMWEKLPNDLLSASSQHFHTIATQRGVKGTQKNIDTLHRASREEAMLWASAKLAELAAKAGEP